MSMKGIITNSGSRQERAQLRGDAAKMGSQTPFSAEESASGTPRRGRQVQLRTDAAYRTIH